MDLKESLLVKEPLHHWYYRSKLDFLTSYVSEIEVNTLVDVGSGSAFFAKELAKSFSIPDIYCVDINYDNEYIENIHLSRIHYVKALPNNVKADLILFMDVLEHVENDADLLGLFLDNLSENGSILITVPAFNFLWSSHDVYLEHYRRYTESSLLLRLSSVTTELQLKSSGYWFSYVFPIVVIVRLLSNFIHKFRPSNNTSNLIQHSKFVNSFLRLLCLLELKFNFRSLPGLSVFAVFKK